MGRYIRYDIEAYINPKGTGISKYFIQGVTVPIAKLPEPYRYGDRFYCFISLRKYAGLGFKIDEYVSNEFNKYMRKNNENTTRVG